MRILLAEDNTINQVVAVAILKKLGYSCSVAEDGIEVMKLLEKTTFDLILMDIEMPNLDGRQTTTRIRQKDGPQPYIVAMSAHDSDNIKEILESCGMDDYIAKPITIEAMEQFLSKWRPNVDQAQWESNTTPPPNA